MSSNGQLLITLFQPHIKGRVYWEATGQPAVREVITIRRADRTVVRRVTTDANGRFDFTTMPGAYVSEQLEVIDARGNRVATFTTNADGSGSVLCPLPAIPSPPPPPPPAQTTRKPVAPTSPVVPVTTARPIVGGTLELHAFVDVNRNLEYDDGDKDLANSDLEIRWPNGTLLKRFTLDDLGMYSFAAGPFPNEPFAVLFLTGQQIGSVTTDSAGSVRAKIRIPPPAAEIDGMLYVDQNGDSSYDSGDTPLANSQVDLKLPNGTLLGRVRTNSAGKFNLITLGTTYAGVELTVSMTATGQVLQTITTDESGKGVADIALSSDTAVIQGSVFVDVDGDSAPSAGDLPSVGTTIVVLFPNGTELARVRTDDAGLFSFPAAARYPGVDFDVVSTSGQVLATFTTDTSGNGRVDVALSAQVPTLGGSLFYDLDGNGAFDPAKDGAMTNKPVVLRFPNGTVYQTLATDSMGRFNVAPGGVTYPNMIFSVLSASGAVLGSLQTDATGSGDALIPLRPALIQGSAWTDANRDTVRNPTEAPLANSVLTIRWNNGTVLTQVSTDSTGRYSLPLIPYPNQKFIIEGPDGVGSKSFTTDAAGNAAANLAIVPGATTATPTRTMASATETRADPLPLLGGKVFIDLNKDGVWTPGSDQPIGNETVALFFPNGTIHGTAITLADGTFAVPLTIFPRNEILTVVLASDPTFAAGTISTDAVGAGYSHVALPPPTISGTIYVDTNADGRLGDADMPLRLEPLVLLFSNGSVYSSVTSLANATFAMDPALPWAPNEDITVVRALDPAVPVGSFKTNSMGSGRIDILLPPPTITGQIWIGKL